MIFIPYEPKVKFRFEMCIDGIDSYLIHTAAKPSIENGEIIIEHINTYFKVKGKSRWPDVSCTLYDPIDIDGSKMVYDWIMAHHDTEAGSDGFAFEDYKKEICFKTLDPNGTMANEWTLKGAYIKDSDWGGGDWSADDAMGVELSIAYDYATYA